MGTGRQEFWKDVQALVGRGLINRRHSAHVLMRITDVAKFKIWLGRDLAQGNRKRLATTYDVDGIPRDYLPTRGMYQIAFSPAGLIKMGVGADVMGAFPEPFLTGMAPRPKRGESVTRRAGILGDVGPNSEEHWEWGGATGSEPRGKNIHVFLMLFSRFENAVAHWVGKALSPESGLTLACGGSDPKNSPAVICTRLEWSEKDENHPIEHFGFLDGVSQPMIKGLGRAERARLNRPETYRLHAVAAGEFVLGHRNERDADTPYPKPFGDNGSYLVVRQLAQHVGAFNDMVHEMAAKFGQEPSQEGLENAAAKLMGRGRDGMPLTDEPRENGSLSSFSFAARDAAGLRCPLGSHVRRANPRDSREDDADTALRLSKRHRIMRRGRIYGPSANNGNFVAKDRRDQGLLFMCVNADISQQFEFIQQTWLNNPTFAGLDGEVDPIVAGREPSEAPFTVQARPFSAKVPRERALVTVKGGAYFFLPGKAALKWLAEGTPEKTGAKHT